MKFVIRLFALVAALLYLGGLVSAQPALTLTLSPPAVTVGQLMSATVSDARGNLLWGDGLSSPVTGLTVTHAYAAAGDYIVLWSCNGPFSPVAGACARAAIKVTLAQRTLNISPTAAKVGDQVTATLTNLQNGDQLDWGDSTVVNAAPSLEHAYSTAGTFTVRLLRGPNAGPVDVAPVPVIISLSTPTLTVFPTTPFVGNTITATLTNFQPGDQVDWSDGPLVPAANTLTHSYSSQGRYLVRLVRGGTPLGSVPPVPVEVFPAASGDVTLTVNPTTALVGETITATMTNFQTVGSFDQLDWGDGSVVLAASTLTHSYRNAGSYIVRVILGREPTFPPRPVPVIISLPSTPTLSVTPTAVLVGEQVTATLTDFQPRDTLDWGDGLTVPAAARLTHAYGKAGTFVIRLLNANAAPYPAPAPVPVVVNLPTPTLTVDPTTARVGETITATLTNFQPGDQVNWSDSPAVPAASTVTHIFRGPGTYLVQLIRGGQALVTVPFVTVQISFPTTTLTVDPTTAQVGEPITATLTNVQPGDQLNWGDGSVIPAASTLKHSYSSPGNYIVRLVLINERTASPVPVAISLPIPTLNVSPTTAQVSETITSTLTNFQPGDQLDWGDGSVVTAAASLTHAYTRAGSFAVKLLRSGQPLAGVAPVPVVVSLPTATLTVSPTTALIGETITATLTNIQPGDQLDWGDSVLVNAAASLTHTYGKAGTFPVRLLRNGQLVAGIAPVPVIIGLPTATLSVSPTTALIGETITAALTIVQPGDQLDWGDTSVVPAAPSLSHSYGSVGTYLVRLLRGGAPLGTVPPVPVTVSVPTVLCSVEVLTTSPLRWKPVQVKINGLTAGTTYSLDWGDGAVVSGVSQAATTSGDGSKQNVQQHTYVRAVSFVVQVKTGTAPPCVQPITVSAGQIALAVDPANPAVDQAVTLSVGDVPTGTALKVDWGDGSVQNLNVTGGGDATSPLGTHAYVKDGPILIKVSLGATGELLGTLPVVVTVPLPTLTVTPARAGTPSTISVGNIQSYPQYVYTLDFGDGTAAPSVTANAEVPHIFAVSGVYSVKLRLGADQATERTAVAVAVIDAAVGIDSFSTEIRPQAGAAIPAPTPAEVQIGTPADSVALLNVTGNGTVNLRWTWTPLNVANQPNGQPVTLETRQVPLKTGQNTVPLTLPSNKSGLFLLRVEVLGVTGDSKAVFPSQVSLQTVNLTEPDLPKFLVLGEGEDQFKFKILGAAKPASGPLFNPNDFWPDLQVADDSPFRIGLTPVALQQIQARNLKVKVDGDTAYLVSGSFEARPQPIKLDTGLVPFVYGEFPAFSPMRLKVQRIVFSPSGAVLSQAVVTSPDFTQAQVIQKLPNYSQQEAPHVKRPGEVMQDLINQIYDPVFSVGLNSAGMPISVPSTKQLQGTLNTLYAQVRGAGGSDASAPSPFLQYTQKGQLPTSTGNGIGYVTQKGKTMLEQAASRGVSTDTGIGKLVVNLPPLQYGTGPKTVEQLQEVLGAGQTDFLTFPELYLSNTGDVVSARMVDGKSVASFPTTATQSGLITVLGGVLKLGDSGVSMNAFGTQTAYLDLSSTRSVEPDASASRQQPSGDPTAPTQNSPAGRINPNVGAALGLSGTESNATSQTELLRRTYGGAPSAVQVPDVGPQWQGLLWLSNQVTIDTVAQYDATKAGSEYKEGQSLSVELVQKVPVSYGTRGWNLNIDGPDGKVKPGKTKLTGGIPYDAREIVVVMVKTNLIRSLTTGEFGPLPFVGGGRLTGTWDIGNKTVVLDKTGLTRAYGPDGSFTAKDVEGTVSEAGVLTFNLLDSTFDLSRVGDGLKLNCSKVIIDGSLLQLPYSTCASITGQNRQVAGNPITFDSLKFTSEGKMILAGLSALGNADENGKNVTAVARFVLSADAQKYSLKLTVDDTAQQVSSTPGHEVNMTLKGSETNLTGVGAQAFGAGSAGSAAQELSFDSGTVAVSDKLSMQVKGLFGHQGSKSYWYLLATGKAADGIPLSFITIYQITGGLAYNMQWGQGQIMFSDLDKRPNDAQGLHLAAGVVASFTGVDDTTLHAAIVAELSSSPLQLRFGGDGYLLTGGIKTAAGYFGGGHPQARFAGMLNENGLFVDLCVGPAEADNLKCSDLKPLSVANGVVTIQGAASIELSKTPHLYIGTFRPKSQIGAAYCNPTFDAACAALYRTGRVSVSVDLAIIKATIDGYVMVGLLDGRSPEFVSPGSFGLAAGASIENIYHAGDSGSVLFCDYSWSFDARLFAAVDGAITVVPPSIAGHVGLYAGAKVSASLCGAGGSISASVGLDAEFKLGNDSYVDGTAHVQISLPVVPDVDFKAHVHLSL
jgi:hypothetical protein